MTKPRQKNNPYQYPDGANWSACRDCGGDRLLEDLSYEFLCHGCDGLQTFHRSQLAKKRKMMGPRRKRP
jgi:hypothetical protein